MALAHVPPRPAVQRRNARLRLGAAVGLALLAVVTLATLDLPSVDRVVTGITTNVPPIVGGFLTPEWSLLPRAVAVMFETLFMAILGTIVGGLFAFPISFLASGNLMPSPVLAYPGKVVLVAVRTFPEILLAIIFVAATGPGPTAGIMAMGIHSIGFLGKIFGDVVEGIDPGPNEAIRAAGGNGLHVFLWSVTPQVLPEFASNLLFRFEINLRAATVLGLVGAGGIGLILQQRLQFRLWGEVTILLLVIVAFVIIVDSLSARLRRSLA